MCIPVLAEENEVALIVKGDNLLCCEMGVVGEQSCQHACYHVADMSSEVVQHHLRVTRGATSMSLRMCQQ